MRKASKACRGQHYRAYLIFVLATILALSGTDGTALGLVLPSVKTALHLTDVELGVLTGIAFSLFYSTAGIPIGRWADRGNRVAIIAICTALWGVMVMLMGAARTFVQLLIVRIGVAVGEAGCVPAAYSLIGDYFTREERPRAISSYQLGASFMPFLGYLGAGWLSFHLGWRAMFVCIGASSLVAAPVAWWTLIEPRRTETRARGNSPSGPQAPAIAHVVRGLWRKRTFRYLLAANFVSAIFGTGIGVWLPSFFVRSYGLRTEQLGLYFAVAYGVGAAIGVYSGGYLASRYAPRDERLQLRAFAFCNVGFGVISAFVYLSTHASVSMALFGLAVLGGNLGTGPVFAAIQTVVPDRMRAISISIVYLFGNLVGGGVGPLIVGALSDAMRPVLGNESLRYALLAISPGYLVVGCLLWQAGRSVVADAEGGEPGMGPDRADE